MKVKHSETKRFPLARMFLLVVMHTPTSQHLQKWTIDILLKNNRIRKHVTDFKTPSLLFRVDVINVWYHSRKQWTLLNCFIASSWDFINAEVSRTAAFFIYISHLTENLQSTKKLFADDTSLFTIINYLNATSKQICEYLISRMVNILLRRQLLQNHLILNLAMMKSKRF